MHAGIKSITVGRGERVFVRLGDRRRGRRCVVSAGTTAARNRDSMKRCPMLRRTVCSVFAERGIHSGEREGGGFDVRKMVVNRGRREQNVGFRSVQRFTTDLFSMIVLWKSSVAQA